MAAEREQRVITDPADQRSHMRLVELPPNVVRPRSLAGVGWLGARLAVASDDLVQLVDRDRKVHTIQLALPVVRMASGGDRLALVCGTPDAAKVIVVDDGGHTRQLTDRAEQIDDVAMVGETVVVVTGPSVAVPTAVTLIDAITGRTRATVPLPGSGTVKVASCDDDVVIVIDTACRRWWRLRLRDCVTVEEGDGSAAVPCGDGVSAGYPDGRVVRPGPDPCMTRLGYPVGQLLARGPYLAAQSRDGRLLTLLDRTTLNTKLEHQFGRAGAAIVFDSTAAELHAFDLDAFRWLTFDLPRIFGETDEGGAASSDDAALFIGRSTQPLIADRSTALGDQRILAIPLLEPGQVVGSTDEIRRFIQSQIVDVLDTYYRDASYGGLRLSADVYGYEGVAVGEGPLTLLHPFETFWNGELVAGGLRIRFPDVADPHRISFDGTEELVVRVTEASRGITDQELTITPPAARLTLVAVIDSTGMGTVTVPVGSVGVLQTEVDGALGTFALHLRAGSYAMPADIARFEADVNAELEAAWAAAGSDPVRRLRARCRLHTRDRDVHIDLHFANPSSAERRVSDVTYAGLPDLDASIASFFFADAHGIDDRFELADHLEAAGENAEIDAGVLMGFSPLVSVRASRTASTLSVRFEAPLAGSMVFVRQSGLENIGLEAATAITRGFESDVTLTADPPLLRFDGSEWAQLATDRGGLYEMRVAALHSSGPAALSPPPMLDFNGVTGELTIDGTPSPLIFPPEMVASDPGSFESYLNRVLASATLGTADAMTASVAADAGGRLLVAIRFTTPPVGGTARRASLVIFSDPELAAFWSGINGLTAPAPIRLDNLSPLEDTFEAALRGLPFERPRASRDGIDVVVELTFDRSQAGAGNSASVAEHRGLTRFGFDTATPIVGNEVEIGREFASKPFVDFGDDLGLGTDLVTALHRRHGGDIDDVVNAILGYHSVMLVCIGAPPSGAGWTSSDTSLDSRMRAFANGSNARSRDSRTVAMDHNWYVALLEGENDIGTTAHEFGHAIGLYDLYMIEGVHRPGLRYFGNRCLMADSSALNTICGYHKLGTRWVDRPVEVPLEPGTTEALIVPLEYHGVADEADVRAAYDGSTLSVATLMRISLGSGAAPFGLIEARQRRGADFGQGLSADGEVLVSHCLDHSGDIRLRDPEGYRRQAHPLTGPGSLDTMGDDIELGGLAKLPIGGTRVEVLDRRPVTSRGETFNVFRVAAVRRDAPILDLFFQEAEPPWRAPDAWVDDPNDGIEMWPVGEPRTQGDTIRVPETDGFRFAHLLRARVHNGSAFTVPRAMVRFYLCKPPGSGDRGNFIFVGEADAVDIAAGRVAVADLDWSVVMGDDGHQCLLVELYDWELPSVPPGDPGFSDDIQEGDNQAQKNFDSFEVVSASPFQPVGFRYSVANDGPDPEFVRLQADGLHPGMRVVVQPAQQWINPNSVGIFHCELSLDADIVQPRCATDRDYALTAWRRTGDAWQRWGGVQYLVKPRKKTTTVLNGEVAFGRLRLSGTVTPSPSAGVVEIQMVTSDGSVIIERVGLSRLGLFELEQHDVDWDRVTVVAVYQGSPEWASSTSDEHVLRHVRLI